MTIIHFLQQFDFDWLILLMKAITFLGNEEFYLLMLPILLWCWRRRDLLPLAVILLVNFWINYQLKEAFGLPRPIGVGLIEADHFGFPSGHAQGAMVLWGFLAWSINRLAARPRYGWYAMIIFMVGLSRVYLGVHFPHDVVGGWSIGFVILFAGITITEKIRHQTPQLPAVPTAMLAVFAGGMLALLTPSPISVRAGGMLAGLVAGIILDGEYVGFNYQANWWQNAVKMLIGLVVVLMLKAGIKALLPPALWADWLRYGLMGAWIGLGAPWLFSRLNLGTGEN